MPDCTYVTLDFTTIEFVEPTVAARYLSQFRVVGYDEPGLRKPPKAPEPAAYDVPEWRKPERGGNAAAWVGGIVILLTLFWATWDWLF